MTGKIFINKISSLPLLNLIFPNKSSFLLQKFFLCLYSAPRGAIAQLGERVLRMYEVAGPNPVCSTILLFIPQFWRVYDEKSGRFA